MDRSKHLDRPPIPYGSSGWVEHLRPYIRARLEQLRDELEVSGADTAFIRGQIAELRDLIRKVEPKESAPGSSGDYFPETAEHTAT